MFVQFDVSFWDLGKNKNWVGGEGGGLPPPPPPNGLAAGCDIICDLLQYTRTKKCNLFAKYTLNNP